MDFTSGVTVVPATLGQVQITDIKPVNIQMNVVPQVPIPANPDHPRCFEKPLCHIKRLARVKEFTEKNRAICERCIWPGR